MFIASALRPMLATLADAPLVDSHLIYELKYDGIRAIVFVEPDAANVRVWFWSRNGNEKTTQFPEIAQALREWGRALDGPVVLDGEVVALDERLNPAGFQRLQHRIHVKAPGYSASKAILPPDEQPTALIAFDLLRDGDEDLRKLPMIERRKRLEALFQRIPSPSTHVRLSEVAHGDGRALNQRAIDEGWEGLIVKQARSPYRDNRRSTEWRKLKIKNQGEFVVGGYTEPKGMRSRFGSLILGAYDTAGRGASKKLRYVGDVGTGFSGKELDRVWALLEPLRTNETGFETAPKTLGKPHWVEPKLVAQVQFTEWTDEGRLRHPVYLGLRDDKSAREVGIEMKETKAGRAGEAGKASGAGSARGTGEAGRPRVARPTSPTSPTRPTSPTSPTGPTRPLTDWQPTADVLVAQLDDLEKRRKNGKLRLPDDDTLEITNLHKVFWPKPPYTKGDLLRYYAKVAPLILPVIDDRPLIMKRLPNGVDAEAFYQHRAPEPIPSGVRIETLPDDDVPARLIGGSLKTLLYMAQLASVSMDPWFSTMSDLDHADQVAIDLDPQPGATFAQILDVARWVRDELERLDVPGYPKTSGSEGLHIFIPLPPGTTYEAGMLFCQIVATMVASKHPKIATVERMVGKRKPGTVYVDYLQNIQGKTLACAYSARGSAFGGVSAPLTWDEVDDAPQPQDFTMTTIFDRVHAVGDLWAGLRSPKRADLMGALEKLQK